MNSGPQLTLVHLFEALCACGEPDELAPVLADQWRDLISFDHLDALIFKENSNEVEWQGWGTALFVLVERLASRRSGEVPGHGVSQLSPPVGD
jgi:hypothetical protein